MSATQEDPITSHQGESHARKQRQIQRTMAAHGVPDFETRTQCAIRQHKMVGRLRRGRAQTETIDGLSQCSARACGMFECRDGCHYATRRLRHDLVPRAAQIFSAHEGPLWFVTIIYPEWSWPSTEPFDPERIQQAQRWTADRLNRLKVPNLLAVGAWEMCLNVELDGSRHWSGNVHLIIAGACHAALKEALAIEDAAALAPNTKPVVIQKVGKLGRQLAYSIKLFAEQRVAYIERDRQNRRHLPLKPIDQLYYDRALCSLHIASRVLWFDKQPHVPPKITIHVV